MPTEPEETRRRPWIVVLVVGIVLALFAWNFYGPSENPNEAPLITSPKQYNDTLEKAERLSLEPLKQFEAGSEPSDQQRQALHQAALLFDGLLAYATDNLGPYMGAAKCYQALGDDKTAVERMQKGIAAVPVSPNLAIRDTAIEAHYVLSVSLFNLHRYDEAKKEIDTAIKMLPFGSPIYLSQRARIDLQLGKYPEASHDVAAALKIDPTNAKAQSMYKLITLTVEGFEKSAVKMLNAKDYKGAVAESSRGLELLSEYPPLLALRAAAYVKTGDMPKAKADVATLKSVDPGNKDIAALERTIR